MWLDAIALGILGLFAGMGALRGGLASGLQLATLITSYAAAIALGPRLAGRTAAALGVPELVAGALAGALVFAVAFVALSGLAAVLRRLLRPRGGFATGRRDRILGGAFGALRGVLVVLLLSWLALWADALRATGVVESLPSLEGSRAARATSATVEGAVGMLLSDSGTAGRIASHLAARPADTLVSLQQLVADPRIAGLSGDRLFWTQVEHGAVDAALNRGSFLKLSRDPSLRRRLADLGAIGPEAVTDTGAFREASAAALREVGPRLRDLRRDPALRELLADPEVVALLRHGDGWQLLRHSGFREVVARAARP